jgi:Mn2+/Fe2+ NRAMP family transporter
MAEQVDPYALSHDAIQQPPPTLGLALRQIGPGLILAGSIVGTGELIATTHLGAKAGFALLWLVIVSCFIKVFVQIELGRYAISSGETTLTTFRRLPGPGMLLVWWWLIMMLTTQTQLGAMVGGVGQAFHMAMPAVSPWFAECVGGLNTAAGAYLAQRPELPWATLIALATAVLLASGSYRLVERGTTLLVVMFTFATVVCVVLLPATEHPFGWGEVASGLSFQVPAVAVMAAFTMFGITGVGASELVAYPYWCIEKGYARSVGPRGHSDDWALRARGWMRVMRLDAWVSMLVYTVATLAFYVLGAAVLHAETAGVGLPNTVGGMLKVLSRMYVPIMGESAAVWFIVLGAFAVLYSTLFAATAGNSRMLTDFLRVNQFVRLASHEDRLWWVRRFCIGFPFLGLLLFVGIADPTLMVMIGGFIQAVTLPMIAAAAVYLRYRRTDRRITSGLVWDVLLWLSMLGLFATALYGMWDTYRKLYVIWHK